MVCEGLRQHGSLHIALKVEYKSYLPMIGCVPSVDSEVAHTLGNRLSTAFL